jgi:hypothetical protein
MATMEHSATGDFLRLWQLFAFVNYFRNRHRRMAKVRQQDPDRGGRQVTPY